MFDFTKYGWIGFDMDHCIAHYNNSTTPRLIHDALYNAIEGLKPATKPTYDQHFEGKGVLLDLEKGKFVCLFFSSSLAFLFYTPTRKATRDRFLSALKSVRTVRERAERSKVGTQV